MMSFWVTLPTSKENWKEINSNMAARETSMDAQRQEDREGHIPIGRAGNKIITHIRGRGCLRPPSPFNPDRDLLAFARGRGLRPASSSNVVRPGTLPQAFGGRS